MVSIKINIFLLLYSELIHVFESSFSADFSDYSISNEACNLAPITYRHSKTIILNYDPDCANQIVFQLSHELCHASIPSDVPDNLRWLEESFAVLSSFFFPLRLKNIVVSKYKLYFQSSLAACKPCFPLSAIPLSDGDLSLLASGSGTNNYNDYGNYWKVAQVMLPLAEKYNDFWKVVPYLCKIPRNLSLKESFQMWQLSVPSDIGDIIAVIKSTLLG